MPVKRSEKRKREESEKTIDTTIEITRAVSSATVNTIDLPNDCQPRKARNGAPARPMSSQRSQPPRIQQSKSSQTCPICETVPARQRVAGGFMILCDIEQCGLWYHDLCLLKDDTKEPKNMLLFSTKQGMNGAAFICPKCLDQPEGYKSDVITEAIGSIVRRVKRLVSIDPTVENSQSPCTSPQFSSQQPPIQSSEDLQWNQDSTVTLQRPKNEKYEGFEQSVIRSLVRDLDKYIFNYNKEVCDVIEVFGDPENENFKTPLKAWSQIDAKASIVAGQQWYQITDPSMNLPNGHTPITASLRTMLQTDHDAPLEIKASLSDLEFPLVHRAFVSWFVLDVLGNKLDIYELPNMKPMRVMMAGIHQFGEERWPKLGRQVVREVQLRTWEKPTFETELFKNTQQIVRKMEAYLEPLTQQFGKITPWSHHRAQLIETTIKLWSYFEAPGGMFEAFQPAIGSPFNPAEQEGYTEDDEKFIPDKRSKKKVFWVTRRGFRYGEKSSQGLMLTTVKAIVIVH